MMMLCHCQIDEDFLLITVESTVEITEALNPIFQFLLAFFL